MTPDAVLRGGLIVLDLTMLLLIAGGVSLGLARLLRGKVDLAFGGFPFFVGESVVLEMVSPRLTTSAHDLTFQLRCLKSRGADRAEQALHVDQPRLYAVDESAGHPLVRLRFDPDPGAPGTRLTGSPTRYWELVGRDLVRFLLPVYDAAADLAD